MDISRSDGFFVDFTEMLRWVDIFFYSHEYQPTFNIGRWFQFQRSWRCWDKKVWECVKVFLNTLKMCKLQWKPVFTYWSCENVHEMGSLHVRRTCAETCEICADMLQSAYMFMFCFPLKIEHVTASTTRFLMEKTAGDCWWSNVYHHEMKPVPNQLGPVKSLFQKGTSNYGSQVPKVGLRRWSISPTDQEKTLKFIAMIRKCSWAKRWANFIYQKWTSFSRCFKLYHSYFTKIFASEVWVKTIAQFEPLKTRVKWTVSKTSWKIHLNFLVGETGSPSS